MSTGAGQRDLGGWATKDWLVPQGSREPWRVFSGDISNLHFDRNTPPYFIASFNPAFPSLIAHRLGGELQHLGVPSGE